MLRRAFLIAVVHLFVVLGCLALSVGAAMRGLDTGAAPSTVARIAMRAGDVLLLPLALPVMESGTTANWAGSWSYMVLVLNSSVWGLVLAWVGRMVWRRHKTNTVRFSSNVRRGLGDVLM
jgi:hypothetical protein